jgi:BirA family biotin operon repressor/biotin-[acetyl-CoA-carboxylase] ligase
VNTAVGLLKILLSSQEPISGQRLASHLGVSRTAVWKAVSRLRQEGLEVDAVRGMGYRLRNTGGKLTMSLIEAALTSKTIGRPVYFYVQTDSTNLRAKEMANQGAPSGALVVADYQTAGRGRLDRIWLSPPGTNLLFSLILRPNLEVKNFFRLTLAAAISLAAGIQEVTGIGTEIKWPNDLLFEGKKLAGILTEIAGQAQALDWAVIGVGLNVGAGPLKENSIYLKKILGQEVDRLALLDAFLNQFEWLLSAGLPADVIQAEWRARAHTIGRVVTISDRQTEVTGLALDIDQDGALLLETTGGVKRIICGDVLTG